MSVTPQDISKIPPVDCNGEMSHCAKLLNRFRKQLNAPISGVDSMSIDWRIWTAKSLLDGLMTEKDKTAK